MGAIYKYRDDVNLNYAPGFADSGSTGADGADGTDGRTFHFAPYELDNSYYADTALQRMQDGQPLSGIPSAGADPVRYGAGDLILTAGAEVYGVEASDSSSGYGLSIARLGAMKSDIPNFIKRIDIAFYASDSSFAGCIPASTCERNALTAQSYEDGDFVQACARIGVTLVPVDADASYGRYSCSLAADIKCARSVSNVPGSDPDKADFSFIKEIEFQDLAVGAENTVYVTAEEADRTVLAGNGMLCTAGRMGGKPAYYGAGGAVEAASEEALEAAGTVGKVFATQRDASYADGREVAYKAGDSAYASCANVGADGAAGNFAAESARIFDGAVRGASFMLTIRDRKTKEFVTSPFGNITFANK